MDFHSFKKSIWALCIFPSGLIALSSRLHLRSTRNRILTNSFLPFSITPILNLLDDKWFTMHSFTNLGNPKCRSCNGSDVNTKWKLFRSTLRNSVNVSKKEGHVKNEFFPKNSLSQSASFSWSTYIGYQNFPVAFVKFPENNFFFITSVSFTELAPNILPLMTPFPVAIHLKSSLHHKTITLH